MKGGKALYSEAVRGSNLLHDLTAEESRRVKDMLVEMYRDINALCRSHGITLMLCGGSCLGAVRHKGFIPWDDDVDLLMPRESYQRFVTLLRQGALGDKYEFAGPGFGADSPCAFLKIYRKGTRWVELGRENSKYPKGLFIDVFIIDTAPANPVLRRIKGFTADLLRLLTNCVSNAAWTFSDAKRAAMARSRRLRFMLQAARIAGIVLAVVPHRRWIAFYDWFVADTSDGPMATIPTGRAHYCGEALPTNVFLPPQSAEFEGVEALIPHDSAAYLANLYGADYMSLPSESERERHFLVEVEI